MAIIAESTGSVDLISGRAAGQPTESAKSCANSSEAIQFSTLSAASFFWLVCTKP